MATVKELIEAIKKTHGGIVVDAGSKLLPTPRIPTGIFAFDVATAGGWPRGRVSIVYGNESSGKTNMVLKTIAQHQRLWPGKVCAYIDVEQVLEESWAQTMGVDTKAWLYVMPDYAEQAVDVAAELLTTEDVGLVVVDSVAALATIAELEKSAEQLQPGQGAQLVQKLIKKSVTALGQGRKDGRFPTLLLVNQVRYKIGVVYGNPEKIPGGEAQRFASSMTVRLWGKNVVDAKIHELLPIRKSTKGQLQKWKVPVICQNFEYEMAMIPHAGLKTGECSDWSTVSDMLKEYGLLSRVEGKATWQLLGVVYPTLTACREKLQQDPKLMDELKKQLIALRAKDLKSPVGESL